MRYDRLYTKLFCQPLLLEAATRTGLEMALLSIMHGDAANPIPQAAKIAPELQDKRSDRILEIQGYTALIHIDGAIDKGLSAFERLCMDACDINDVQKALSRIASDTSIKNVMLVFNSPGGSVSGIPETADKIRALAASKNVFAFADGMCCSAAYWLASACDQIFATPSSSVGSIGVYLALLDQSRSLETKGMKIETIKDGKLKAAGASWKPLTDEEKAHFQDSVYQIGATFREAVSQNRNLSEDTMQGQSFMGQSCVDNGLVDALVSDLDAALAQF
jgi:protease-4